MKQQSQAPVYQSAKERTAGKQINLEICEKKAPNGAFLFTNYFRS